MRSRWRYGSVVLPRRHGRSRPAPHQPPGALCTRLKQWDDEARVRFVDIIDDRKAINRENLIDLRHLHQQLGDATDDFARAVNRSAIRQLHVYEERALVLFWQETGRRAECESQDRSGTDRDQHNAEDRDPYQASHDRRIAITDILDVPQYPTHRTAPHGAVAQKNRTERRRQG